MYIMQAHLIHRALESEIGKRGIMFKKPGWWRKRSYHFKKWKWVWGDMGWGWNL